MEQRDYFLFYRSFYQAIRELPKDIKLEVLSAIIEYALDGTLPQQLKPFANGMFTLVKPIIDRNRTLVENGKKGGRKSKKQEPVIGKAASQGKELYNMSFEDEVERMKSEKDWLDIICHDFNISPEELAGRFVSFLDYCKRKRKNKPHDSFEDAQSHLRYWMAKAYPTAQQPAEQPFDDNFPSSDYTYSGGFGGLDV